jgi:virulence-associated protein VapD
VEVTIKTDNIDEAHQMILAMNVLADLDDFRRYLRDKLKYAVEDVSVVEEIYGEFCEGVGKHLE